MSSVALSAGSDFAVRRRPDVVVRLERRRSGRVWTLKDPVGLRYYQLNDEEFWIYEQLDGRKSLAELRQAFERRFAPKRLEGAMLMGFVHHLHREGLVVVDGEGQGEQLLLRRRETRRNERLTLWTRLFSWRFRGVDPERFLNAVYPWVRPLFTPAAAVAAGLLVVAALGTAVVALSRVQDFESATAEFLRPDRLVFLLAVMAGVKLLHELGHALACKHYGGECHEIGVMFFLFAPGFYCNVSDAWMFPDRWSRMVVGAAGIGVELLLAAAATLLWQWSEPGWFHSACLYVAVLCSVNTLLMNGNPLLRYDGYHVLADFVEVPNLATRAGDVWRRWARRLWFGQVAVDREADSASESPAATAALAAYAAASKIYVAVVIVAALRLLYVWGATYRLEPLVYPTIVAVIVAMAGMPVYRAAKRGSEPNSLVRAAPRRFGMVTAALVLVLLAVALIPLPRTVEVTAVLRPADADAVYVTEPGFLRWVTNQRQVTAGEVLAVLESEELRRELVDLEAELRQATSRLELLELRQADPTLKVDLPTARQAVTDAERRLQARRDAVEKLTLRAARAGALMPPARKPAAGDGRDLPEWSGDLMEPGNLGAYLDAGTTFGYVGDPLRAEGVAEVDGAEMLDVQIGAEAVALADVANGVRLTGRVVEAGAERSEGGGGQAQRRPASGESAPRAGERDRATFRIRIAFSEPCGFASLETPVLIRITAPAESLGTKALRWGRRTFRFE